MSDTLQGAPVEGVANGPESGGNSQRRLLMVVVLVAGALVLGAATYFLFLSGGGEEELAPITKGTPSVAPEKDKKGGEDVEGDKVPQKVDDDFKVGRDPFEPLAAEEPVVVPEVPADGTDPTDPTGTDDPAATAGTYQVTVKRVNLAKDTAAIDVDGKVYTVKAGSSFPSKTMGPFRLIRVDVTNSGGGLARVVFGSDIPVVMKVGNTVSYTIG